MSDDDTRTAYERERQHCRDALERAGIAALSRTVDVLMAERAAAAAAAVHDFSNVRRPASAPITGEFTAAGHYRTHLVQLWLCEACLLGAGRECHTPSCALCWHNSPGHAIDPGLYTVIERDTTP